MADICCQSMVSAAVSAVVSAAVTLTVAVMTAHNIGIKAEHTVQQILNCCVSIARNASIERYACLSQRHFSSASDSSADKCVHSPALKESSQCAVTASLGRNHLTSGNCAVLYIIYFEFLCVTKMLKDLTIIISYRNLLHGYPYPFL